MPRLPILGGPVEISVNGRPIEGDTIDPEMGAGEVDVHVRMTGSDETR